MNDLKQMIIGVGACCFLLFLMGCGGMRKPAKQSQALPSIFPDYTDVTIGCVQLLGFSSLFHQISHHSTS